MAAARLSALAAVASAVWLAVSASVTGGGAGVVSLIGWIGVGMLGAGLLLGFPGGVSAATVALVLQRALATVQGGGPSPALWLFGVVLMVEMAGASSTLRTRPGDPALTLVRALVLGVVAALLFLALASVERGVVGSGILVRGAAITAVVVAAGWVAWLWRRAGLSD